MTFDSFYVHSSFNHACPMVNLPPDDLEFMSSSCSTRSASVAEKREERKTYSEYDNAI